jgi:hypothetical protein
MESSKTGERSFTATGASSGTTIKAISKKSKKKAKKKTKRFTTIKNPTQPPGKFEKSSSTQRPPSTPWNTTEKLVLQAANQPLAVPGAAKRGRKPGVKNKPKVKAKLKPAVKEKVSKPKADKKPLVIPKPTPQKRGPKPKIQGISAEAVVSSVAKPVKQVKPAKKTKVAKPVKATKPGVKKASKPAAKRGPKPVVKPAAKRGPKPKITLDTVTDDGLPTLNKVLEAYAKSTGPRGKVGEIN